MIPVAPRNKKYFEFTQERLTQCWLVLPNVTALQTSTDTVMLRHIKASSSGVPARASFNIISLTAVFLELCTELSLQERPSKLKTECKMGLVGEDGMP